MLKSWLTPKAPKHRPLPPEVKSSSSDSWRVPRSWSTFSKNVTARWWASENIRCRHVTQTSAYSGVSFPPRGHVVEVSDRGGLNRTLNRGAHIAQAAAVTALSLKPPIRWEVRFQPTLPHPLTRIQYTLEHLIDAVARIFHQCCIGIITPPPTHYCTLCAATHARAKTKETKWSKCAKYFGFADKQAAIEKPCKVCVQVGPWERGAAVWTGSDTDSRQKIVSVR